MVLHDASFRPCAGGRRTGEESFSLASPYRWIYGSFFEKCDTHLKYAAFFYFSSQQSSSGFLIVYLLAQSQIIYIEMAIFSSSVLCLCLIAAQPSLATLFGPARAFASGNGVQPRSLKAAALETDIAKRGLDVPLHHKLQLHYIDGKHTEPSWWQNTYRLQMWKCLAKALWELKSPCHLDAVRACY